MEHVRHHVSGSGNDSVRGFFSSENVDFDPPSLSLRQNIAKAKAKVIYDLASGATGDEEEDAIRDHMVRSENSYEIIRMMRAIGGWKELDNELPEGYLDDIARQLAQVLDQRDYVVYQLIRRYLVLLDYAASPNLGDCFVRLLQWPVKFQKDEFDFLLSLKGKLLKGIASATMRNRLPMVNAAMVPGRMTVRDGPEGVIGQYFTASPHRADELRALMFEVYYTTRICNALARLEYRTLYDVIVDMIDPDLTNLQRTACRNTFKNLVLELTAAEKSVETVGSNEAKNIVSRFMLTLHTSMGNFPDSVPAPTVFEMIRAAINATANTVGELRSAIFKLPDAVAGIINLGNFTGSSGDDQARHVITNIFSNNALANTSFEVKDKLVKALLDGWTVDDDEDQIIKVMKAAQAHDKAELYQLAASATWESLDTSVDGKQYKQLEDILNQPE